MKKLKILFLCTGNSCRSQMAEGWTRQLKGDVLEPYSAGIEKHRMNPRRKNWFITGECGTKSGIS